MTPVKLRTAAAGLAWSGRRGQTVSLPDSEAERFVRAGLADRVPTETTTTGPSEHAARRVGRPQPRGRRHA